MTASPLERLNPLKRVIGILIGKRCSYQKTIINSKSQSPKAGHRYSDFMDNQTSQKGFGSQSPKAGHRYSDKDGKEWNFDCAICLNPLKRVIGILIEDIVDGVRRVEKSQSPKAGHRYSDTNEEKVRLMTHF